LHALEKDQFFSAYPLGEGKIGFDASGAILDDLRKCQKIEPYCIKRPTELADDGSKSAEDTCVFIILLFIISFSRF
jgi:hypothetical protein